MELKRENSNSSIIPGDDSRVVASNVHDWIARTLRGWDHRGEDIFFLGGGFSSSQKSEKWLQIEIQNSFFCSDTSNEDLKEENVKKSKNSSSFGACDYVISRGKYTALIEFKLIDRKGGTSDFEQVKIDIENLYRNKEYENKYVLFLEYDSTYPDLNNTKYKFYSKDNRIKSYSSFPVKFGNMLIGRFHLFPIKMKGEVKKKNVKNEMKETKYKDGKRIYKNEQRK
jgi:hypothetical protein